MTSRQFHKRIREAVGDPNLNLALDRAMTKYAQVRAEAFDGLDFESLREQLRDSKERSLSRIPELFERFRIEAERVGGKVYHADGPAEANRIISELAESHGVRKIVKSKSMVTEEIELNRSLIAQGLQVTETDLGEWICQLAGERPSNLTVPAIHKTREQVAELFSKALGEPIAKDIPAMVEVARKYMRRAFIEADMGISGANIAIADTGTLVLVSNEGNARLVTSLPEIHVAVVGYDRLVPSIDEATSMLKMLSKCGTGQKMTSYVSFITGPSRTSDIEKTLTLGCHGPREVHIIFVDNGRLTLLNDPEFREALYCIKCGGCLSVCPVYRSVGGHVFGDMYFGGIGAVLQAFLKGVEHSEEMANLCAACGRCKTYCPAGIDVPRMIDGLRRKLAKMHGRPWTQRALMSILGNPERFDASLKFLRAAQKLVTHGDKTVKQMPFPFSGLTGFRTLPALAPKPLRELLPEISEAERTKRGTVVFFPGCVIGNVYPEIGTAVVKVLTSLGWEVRLLKGQGCCGMPALVKGDCETARALAKHNLGSKGLGSADYVITACPTCLTALKIEYPRLLEDDTAYAQVAERISSRMHDFSEFVAKIAKIEAGDLKNKVDELVTYHDPCHARHGLGIWEEPRSLLKLAGCEFVEMPNSDSCCGFAGSYSLTYPEVSESILKRKLDAVRATDASTVVTDCPGCLIQLRGGLEKAGSRVRAMHTAEILAKQLPE